MSKKRRRKRFRKNNKLLFYNSVYQSMDFEKVKEKILDFIKQDPVCFYEFSIGTDSQARDDTLFVTGIIVRRVGADGIGRGAWACLKDYYVERRIESLREKISLETSLSQEIAYMVLEDLHEDILDILLPYAEQGADCVLSIHIDVGENGPTKELISEMVGRVKSMGLEAEIKPDSYAASGYANRYTK